MASIAKPLPTNHQGWAAYATNLEKATFPPQPNRSGIRRMWRRLNNLGLSLAILAIIVVPILVLNWATIHSHYVIGHAVGGNQRHYRCLRMSDFIILTDAQKKGTSPTGEPLTAEAVELQHKNLGRFSNECFGDTGRPAGERSELFLHVIFHGR